MHLPLTRKPQRLNSPLPRAVQALRQLPSLCGFVWLVNRAKHEDSGMLLCCCGQSYSCKLCMAECTATCLIKLVCWSHIATPEKE